MQEGLPEVLTLHSSRSTNIPEESLSVLITHCWAEGNLLIVLMGKLKVAEGK